jgi:hypothetical protein
MPHWIAETTIMRCSLAIMTTLGHRAQIVPVIHQRIIAKVWATMIHNGCNAAAVVIAFTYRMRGKVCIAKVLPAPIVIGARLGLIVCLGAFCRRLPSSRNMQRRAYRHCVIAFSKAAA